MIEYAEILFRFTHRSDEGRRIIDTPHAAKIKWDRRPFILDMSIISNSGPDTAVQRSSSTDATTTLSALLVTKDTKLHVQEAEYFAAFQFQEHE